MEKEEFRDPPGSPHDYRFIQTLGPWDLAAEDTITVAFALGIGEGLEGMRRNLQYGFDMYQSQNLGPVIESCIPSESQLTLYQGESCEFQMTASPRENEPISYLWYLDDDLSACRDNTFTLKADHFEVGEHWIRCRVAGPRYYTSQSWLVDVRPPKKFDLTQNFPNPFNGTTRINFELKEPGRTTLNIYNLEGRVIRKLLDQHLDFGPGSVVWDGTDTNGKSVASGMYFYRLQTGKRTLTKKMFYLK